MCMYDGHYGCRLYLSRAGDFGPDAATTLEGRHRVIDELLFFSPPNAKFISQIGYAESGNVVPAPPLRLAYKGTRTLI